MSIDPIFTIAAVITAVGVIIGGIVSVYRLAQKISESIGLDHKGRTLSERLDRVEHQLWENGGSSLADRVNSIETHVIKTTAEIEIIKNLVLGSAASVESPTPTKRTRIKKVS
jgi:hypothetical protein